MVFPKMVLKVLIERLKEAIRNRVGLLNDRPGVEVANIAGEGFSPGSYENEHFFFMDEAPPEQQQPIIEATPVVENSENLIPVGTTITAGSVLDDELALIDTLKVVELRQELESRGVSKNGLKKVLIERLKEAIRNRVGLLSDRPGVEVANIAGEGFSPGSYWKLLEPDESDEVDESVMHIYGIYFRDVAQLKCRKWRY